MMWVKYTTHDRRQVQSQSRHKYIWVNGLVFGWLQKAGFLCLPLPWNGEWNCGTEKDRGRL
jgi:hypothetical protein